VTTLRAVRWNEPAAFKRAMSRQGYRPPNGWYPLLTMLGMAGCLGAMALRGEPLAGSWAVSVALLVAVAVGAAYGSPHFALLGTHFAHLVPHPVALSEAGVNHTELRGSQVVLQFWPWAEISHCTLEHLTLSGETFSVLVLHLHNGETRPIALAKDASPDEIEAVVCANGKELHRRA